MQGVSEVFWSGITLDVKEGKCYACEIVVGSVRLIFQTFVF